jgi:hypothetical protein
LLLELVKVNGIVVIIKAGITRGGAITIPLTTTALQGIAGRAHLLLHPNFGFFEHAPLVEGGLTVQLFLLLSKGFLLRLFLVHSTRIATQKIKLFLVAYIN